MGAVIVDPEQRQVASGYNGPATGFDHGGRGCVDWCQRAVAFGDLDSRSYDDCPALHAEANALMVGDRRDRLGGTIYVTSHVCFNCAKLIANAGLARVVVGHANETSPWRKPERSYQYLRDCGLEVTLR